MINTEFSLPNINAQMTLKDRVQRLERLEMIEYVRANTAHHHPKLRGSIPCFHYSVED